MADINTVYSGTIDVQDPDIVIAQLPGFWPWDPPRKLYLPDEARDQIRATNAAAVATVEAVKVAYSGKTSTDRVAFLTDRLTAVNNRVAFIQARTGQLLQALQSISGDAYDTAVKLVSTALKAVPIIGSAVSYFTGQADAAKQLEQYKLQSLIQSYVGDLTQLTQIRSQFIEELQAIKKAPTTTTEPTSESPNIRTDYILYAVGAVALITFLIWRKRQRSKRSKR